MLGCRHWATVMGRSTPWIQSICSQIAAAKTSHFLNFQNWLQFDVNFQTAKLVNFVTLDSIEFWTRLTSNLDKVDKLFNMEPQKQRASGRKRNPVNYTGGEGADEKGARADDEFTMDVEEGRDNHSSSESELQSELEGSDDMMDSGQIVTPTKDGNRNVTLEVIDIEEEVVTIGVGGITEKMANLEGSSSCDWSLEEQELVIEVLKTLCPTVDSFTTVPLKQVYQSIASELRCKVSDARGKRRCINVLVHNLTCLDHNVCLLTVG